MSSENKDQTSKWMDNMEGFSKPDKEESLKWNAYANNNDPDFGISIQDALKSSKLKKIKLDSCFQNLFHPFILFLTGIGFLVVFLIFRYLSIFTDYHFFDVVYNDLVYASGYIFTSVVTAIITEFIALLKKNQ